MGLEECLKQGNRVCTRRSGQGCLGRLRKHLLEDLCTTCFFAVCFITRHFGHSICNFHIPKLRKQINTRNEHGAKKNIFARMLTAIVWFATILLRQLQWRSAWVKAWEYWCFFHADPADRFAGLCQRKRLGPIQKSVWPLAGLLLPHFRTLWHDQVRIPLARFIQICVLWSGALSGFVWPWSLQSQSFWFGWTHWHWVSQHLSNIAMHGFTPKMTYP